MLIYDVIRFLTARLLIMATGEAVKGWNGLIARTVISCRGDPVWSPVREGQTRRSAPTRTMRWRICDQLRAA